MRWCWVPYQYYNIIIFIYMNASNKFTFYIIWFIIWTLFDVFYVWTRWYKLVNEYDLYIKKKKFMNYIRIVIIHGFQNNIIIFNVLNGTCN
jgi:hypothetical protein